MGCHGPEIASNLGKHEPSSRAHSILGPKEEVYDMMIQVHATLPSVVWDLASGSACKSRFSVAWCGNSIPKLNWRAERRSYNMSSIPPSALVPAAHLQQRLCLNTRKHSKGCSARQEINMNSRGTSA